MLKRFVVLTMVLSILLVSFAVTTAQDAELGPITQGIVDRGSLVCGVNNTLQGFGFADESGNFSGFDVDTCRAVAAAILGDADAVDYIPVIAADRQAVMQSGEIDLMVRNTTWTLSRDVVWGAIFGPTTFYDGQGVMVPTELGVSSIAELDGGSICVQAGTTTELNIADFVATNGLDIELPTFPDNPSTTAAYLEGACQGLTTDKSGLASIRADQEDPGAHTILAETLSKEPLGPLSPQSDPQFAEIVAWVVYGQMQAEESGITSENVGDFLDSEDPRIQRLLGQNDNTSGDYLGIANDFMIAVIEQVGNYGEQYDRHLAPLGLEERGPNAQWTDGGLIYAPPFR